MPFITPEFASSNVQCPDDMEVTTVHGHGTCWKCSRKLNSAAHYTNLPSTKP